MIVARAPNHLGDGVMALPAITALTHLDEVVIHARPGVAPLFRHLAPTVPPSRCRADAAVLFTPSFGAAWTARDAARRVGTATDARGWLLTDRVPETGHRRDTYAALAGCLGAGVQGEPTFSPRGRAARVPEGHVGIQPVSRGGPPRDWPGFRALAARLRRPVVFYGGPGEERALRPYRGLGTVLAGLSLVDLAATLQRCAVFVSNDTGPAHFARAVGVRTVVLHLSTDPTRTGPAGAEAVIGPRPPCAPCYRQRCSRDLACTRVPVEQVLARVAL